jgi:hypothetical protein
MTPSTSCVILNFQKLKYSEMQLTADISAELKHVQHEALPRPVPEPLTVLMEQMKFENQD